MPQANDYVPQIIIDVSEITETEYVDKSPAIPGGPGGSDDGSGIQKVTIDPLPYLPPKPMPTPGTPWEPKGGRGGLPEMPKSPTDTETITKTVVKVDPSIYSQPNPNGGGGTSTGTYGVIPTVRTSIPPIKPIPPIKINTPKKPKPELKDETADKIIDVVLGWAGKGSGKIERTNNEKTTIDLIDKAHKYAKAKEKLEDAKKRNDRKAIADAEVEVEETKQDLRVIEFQTVLDIVFSTEILVMKTVDLIKDLFEEDSDFVKEEIRNIDEERRRNPSSLRDRELLREKGRLIKKLNEMNKKK